MKLFCILKLSILSRFYFINTNIADKHLTYYAFNPIKVLFYLRFNLTTCLSSVSFQSYQGSILSAIFPLDNEGYPTFNPIKVLFYRDISKSVIGILNPLSILSRFYFIPFLKSRNMLYIFSMGFEKKAHIGSSCYSIKRLDTFCFLNNVLNSSLILFNHDSVHDLL